MTHKRQFVVRGREHPIAIHAIVKDADKSYVRMSNIDSVKAIFHAPTLAQPCCAVKKNLLPNFPHPHRDFSQRILPFDFYAARADAIAPIIVMPMIPLFQKLIPCFKKLVAQFEITCKLIEYKPKHNIVF